MGDERLIDALRAPGCGLCTFAHRGGREYLGSVLGEHVNDRQFRRRFQETGGFCARHTLAASRVERQRSGGMLGAAILYRAMLAGRRESVGRALGAGRPSERQLREAIAPPRACLGCEQETVAEQDAVGRLVEHATRDPAWEHAVAYGAWCIVHVGALAAALVAGRHDRMLASFRAGQSERLAELDARLERFIHHSATDRRHLQTDDERAAVTESARTLAGSETESD
jgi:hypothetical protein